MISHNPARERVTVSSADPATDLPGVEVQLSMTANSPRVVLRSDVGQVRDHNEDSAGHRVDTRIGDVTETLVVVCDGMGGHAAGEVASALAVDTLLDHYFLTTDPIRRHAIFYAIQAANDAVFEGGRRDPLKRGMGSTCVAAVVVGSEITVGHVGDCRAYITGPEGVRRLTTDHSWVAEQIKAGLITEEQAHTSAFRSVITRAIGLAATVDPDITSSVLLPGETLVLCSDGLWDLVGDSELATIVREAESLDRAADLLIELANQRGGPDNISVALVAHLRGPVG